MFHFSSVVVNHLKARYLKDLRKSVAYWSFDDNAKEFDDLEAMPRSLMTQIMPPGTPIRDFVHQAMQAFRRGAVDPPATELSDLLQRICREARRDIYLIIDGINQCGDRRHITRRAKMLTILHDLTACGVAGTSTRKSATLTVAYFRDRWYRAITPELLKNLYFYQNFYLCPHTTAYLGNLFYWHFEDGVKDAVRRSQRSYVARGLMYKRLVCRWYPTEVTVDAEPLSNFVGMGKWM